MNRDEFVEKQRQDVAETLQKMKEHRDALEERTQLEPDDDRMRDFLEDAQEGVEALEAIAAEFADAKDAEDLVKHAEAIEDWIRKENEIAQALEK